ncbi:MAG: hypothetical protein HY776_01180 [Actinobacteria bacterium]|nr:hypothetical protein [Actinomycetota bacterium]
MTNFVSIRREKLFKLISFIISLSMLFVSFSGVALAAEDDVPSPALKIGKLDLSVWPEYDDPRVLVIYNITLKQPYEFPFRIKFLIPKDAFIGMACEVTETGGHTCKPTQRVNKGDYDELSYVVQSRPTLFFEYYYNPLKGDTNKSFDFIYKPVYEIDDLKVEVQEPLKSTNFKLEPPSTESSTDSAGFKLNLYGFKSVKKDQPIGIKVSYTKSDPNPSVEKKKDQTGGGQTSAPGAAASGSGTGNNTLIIVLGIIAIVSVFFSGYFLSTSRQGVKTKPRGSKPRKNKNNKKI